MKENRGDPADDGVFAQINQAWADSHDMFCESFVI